MKRCTVMFLVVTLISEYDLKAQNYLNASSAQIGIGMSNLSGDLGGGQGKGSNFVNDFDNKSTRFGVSANLGWKKNQHFDLCMGLSYLYLHSSDQYSEEPSRNLRNLSVRTSVVELVPSFRYNFFNSSHRNHKKWSQKNFTHMYVSLGTGVICYTSNLYREGTQASDHSYRDYQFSNSHVSAQRTRLSIVMPLTLGLKSDISLKSSIFLELTARKCFSDFIDGLGSSYEETNYVNQEETSGPPSKKSLAGKAFRWIKEENSGKNDSYFTATIGYRRDLNWLDKRRI